MYILIVLIIAISTAASANTIELSCPAMVETKQEIIDAPSGWDVSTSSPTQLDKPPSSTSKHNAMRIGFSGGHPSERAILAPDREIKSKKGQYTQSIWFFSKSEENWFICSYHNSAEVRQ